MKKLKSIKEAICQMKQASEALSGLASESLKLFLSILQCFGIFFTLIYAVRQLLKELHSSL